MATSLNKDLIVNTISDGFWANDLNGNFIEVNDALCTMLEYSREELLKMNIKDIEVAESANKSALNLKRIVEQGSDTYVTKHRSKNGKIVDVSINANFNKQVSPDCIYVFSKNISEKVENTDESQRIMHALLDAIDDVIYVADPDTYELLFVNEKFKEQWGDIDYAAKCYKVLQGRSEPCPFCTNRLIFGDYLGKSYVWEFQNEITKNWYRCSDRAIDWVDGRKVRFEIATDITEIKESQKNLIQSEREFRSLFENSPLGKSMTGVDGSLRVNKAFCDILGYTLEELQGINWKTLTHPEDIQESANIVESLLKGEKEAAHYEKRYIHKNGNIIYADVNTTLLHDEKGNPIYFITSISDISERKEMELKLKRAFVDIERSNKELEQFAYVASHDLQEPLRMVSSYTQLLAKRYSNKLDNDALDFINYAVDGANRMQRLINDLLEYSRITTRGSEFKPVSLPSVLGQALANLHLKIAETGTLVTNDDLPMVNGDETQLVRLLQNLIENAIKYKGDLPPRIHIGVKSNSQEYIISVSDNGIGIEKEYFEKIFVIFQRLHNKFEFQGTGIGLSICKRIVERHGGKIWVESEINNGSIFYFSMNK